MNIQELATIAENDLDVRICVFNNGHLGLVRQQQELFYGKRYVASRFTARPDFAAIARGFGIRGCTLDARGGPAELTPLLAERGTSSSTSRWPSPRTSTRWSPREEQHRGHLDAGRIGMNGLPNTIVKLKVKNHPGRHVPHHGTVFPARFQPRGDLCAPVNDGRESAMYLLVRNDETLEQIVKQLRKLYDVTWVAVQDDLDHTVFNRLEQLLGDVPLSPP